MLAGSAWAAPESLETSAALQAEVDLALELEREVEEHRAELVALEERIDVTNLRIYRQQEALADARAHMAQKRDVFEMRVIRMYKSRSTNPMAILLTSDSISDFYARALMLARIARQDRSALSEAALATSEAEYEAAYLDDLKAQDLALRHETQLRTEQLALALKEQQQLVERLTEEERKRLEAERAAAAAAREEWRSSSLPIGSAVPLKTAMVEPYADQIYLVPEYQPSLYKTTGRTMTAVCSWYGNEFNGRRTASGQIFNEEDFTCASRTLPFGTRLALTRNDRRIIVVVTDRGPFIAGRDLDLSKAAARALGFSGVEPVHAEFIEAVD
jgi:rare lipoprotein A